MSIYSHQYKQLHELLTLASQEATLLIPDLQRPYVWTPRQVLDLIDSLLKGWPFGTLLLWNLGPVNQNEHLIPSRQFWSLVDRAEESSAQSFMAATRPNEFLMALDGQQRVQSLLLAFACEGAGMKLLDRDWKESIEGKSPYHGVNARKHWTTGSLYLDLFALESQLNEDEDEPDLRSSPDFNQLLVWCCSGHQGSQNTTPTRPKNYLAPLQNTMEYPGRYIRLSRLWSSAGRSLNQTDVYLKKDIVMPILQDHDVDQSRITHTWRALRSFIKLLQAAQQQRVEFLQLNRFEQSGYQSQEEYNDAIVNIFTRLNSAGRTLTREEITFAWVKVVWPSAVSEIDLLRQHINAADENLRLGSDGIVKMLSTAWSVFQRDGDPVRDRDLLDGVTVRALATWLEKHWFVISTGLAGVTGSLQNLGLRFGNHYRSVNALTLLAIWRLSYDLWVSNQTISSQDRDLLLKNADLHLEHHAEAWILFSQWAGNWAQRTDDTVSGYMKGLAACLKQCGQVDYNQFHKVMKALLCDWVSGLQEKTIEYIDRLQADDRGSVSSYRVALALWQREDAARNSASQVSLKAICTRKQPDIEVDHIVPWSHWESLTDSEQLSKLRTVGNSIGNCTLLSKTFNVTKHAKPLDTWLSELQPMEGFDPCQWKHDLWIPSMMAGSVDQSNLHKIARLILLREKKIKMDLKRFVISACSLNP